MVIFLIETDNVDIVFTECACKFGAWRESESEDNHRKVWKNRDSLRVDVHLGAKPFKFRGKIVKISYDIPPNPWRVHHIVQRDNLRRRHHYGKRI